MATPKLEKNGKTWGVFANFTNAQGKLQRKYKGGFESKAKAQKWATSYVEEMKSKGIVPNKLKIADVIKKLLHEKEFVDGVAQKTMEFYESNFAFITKEFGELFPPQITALMLQDFVNRLIETPRKCKAICQCLSLLYSYMERLDITDRNLYKKLNVPEYKAKETNFYDLDTYKLILQKALERDNCVYTPLLLMGSLGLRPSEALALTNADLNNNTLSINKARVIVKRNGQPMKMVTGGTKTEKSKRTFQLNAVFVAKILSYKTRHKIHSDYLCVNATGEPMSYTVLKKNLRNLIDQCNKEYRESTKSETDILPHISPYGFRHTFGQAQKALDTDVYTVSRIMGHSNIDITTKTYFHDDKKLNQSAIEKITDRI